jgi:nucleoside-diphosphate-sugar epimerase
MNVVVTGGSGFVGRALLQRLVARPSGRVTAAVRRQDPAPVPGVRYASVGDLAEEPRWREALDGCDVVVHAAARVHVMSRDAASDLQAFRRVNVEGTRRLLDEAIDAGVRRFVLLSSVKVNGEVTPPGCRFAAGDEPRPEDAYGVSKLEAETLVREKLGEAGIEWVIVRPPLVYGPGVGANFRRLMSWVGRGVPLPFASIDNRRSLVALDNLVSLVEQCASHPGAARRIFLAADGEDVSTPELLRRIAGAMHRPARLVPVPPALLRAGAACVGLQAYGRRLLDSLQVDSTDAQALMGWRPIVSVDEGIARTVESFLANAR